MNKKLFETISKLEFSVGAEQNAFNYGRDKACECTKSCRNSPTPSECVHQCYVQHMGISDGNQIGPLYGECLVKNVCQCVNACVAGYGGIGGNQNQVNSCAQGCSKRFGGVVGGDIVNKCKKYG